MKERKREGIEMKESVCLCIYNQEREEKTYIVTHVSTEKQVYFNATLKKETTILQLLKIIYKIWGWCTGI